MQQSTWKLEQTAPLPKIIQRKVETINDDSHPETVRTNLIGGIADTEIYARL